MSSIEENITSQSGDLHFSQLRNIAIIAHVDHGKTTLVDNLMKQSGTFRENQDLTERMMDKSDLEKEYKITIFSKWTSVFWKSVKINVIDTPGHVDFGGEVERILSMADGVVLLVDAAEGPMPQTKFVLSKALAEGFIPIVVINKVDRADARIAEVIEEIYELFLALDATSDQLDFPILYASGRDGWCVANETDKRETLAPLFDKIISHISHKKYDETAQFKMLVSLLDRDKFLGRVLIGKIYSGTAKINSNIKALNIEGASVEQGRMTKLFVFSGLKKVPVESVIAGDIVAIAGLEKASVSDTICEQSVTVPIQSKPVDPPTMAITIGANDSPLSGREGTKQTLTAIRDRLVAEAETNVSISVSPTAEGDAYEVGGRGELQLGILIETMRREGFELSVSRPRVIFKTENGKKLEPLEDVIIDVDEECSGIIMEKMSFRKADVQDIRSSGMGRVRMQFIAPSRGLIGYQGEFLSDSSGTGIMNRLFHGYGPYKGSISGRRNGVLIANEGGSSTSYSICGVQERGIMFIGPQETVYEGMIVGQHSRDMDLVVNVTKGKQLTNMRASGSDAAIYLVPHKTMTLEQMIAYIDDDELVEVTPKSLRLRKKKLTESERKRDSKKRKED